MNERFAFRLGFFFSLVASAFVFFYLYGISFLSPFSFAWLMHGDPAQHFLGFNFFLNEPWQWPLGKITNLNWPSHASLVYTDSIPLVSIPLKLFTNGLIQFHGIWTLVCFLLQGGVAFVCVSKLTPRSATYSALGSLIFILFPSFLLRGFEVTRHYSCLAHFLILSTIFLAIQSYALDREKIARPISKLWYFILFLSLGIHFYFFYLNALIFAVSERKALFKKSGLGILASLGTLTLLLMAVYGYFVIPLENSFTGGFGYYSMNLLSWFNPGGFSFTHLKLPTVSDEQLEGFQYLGLGTLVLGILIFFKKENRLDLKMRFQEILKTPYAILISFFLFLAFSICLSLGTLRVPDYITAAIYLTCFFLLLRRLSFNKVKSVGLSLLLLLFYLFSGHLLRASGRAGWYGSYLLIFGLLSFKPKTSILFVVVVLQLIDVFPILARVRAENQSLVVKNQALFNEVDSFEKDHIQSFIGKDPELILVDAPDELPLEYFALVHHFKIGPIYLARGKLKKEGREWTASERTKIKTGDLKPSEILITSDFSILGQLEAPTKILTLKSGNYLWIKSAEKN
jgi:hypothetical protein